MIIKDLKSTKVGGNEVEKIISNGDLVWVGEFYYANELKAAAEDLTLGYDYTMLIGRKVYKIYCGYTLRLPNKIRGHDLITVSWRSSNANVVSNNWRVNGVSGQSCYLIATLTMQGTRMKEEVYCYCKVQ